jgi:protein-L-isoaspartate(D-aspartate) O-methyltransferase
VQVREADGRQPVGGAAAFDAIVLSGSVAQVPEAVLAQLKPGGRLVTIEGSEPIMQAVLYTRQGDGAFTKVALFDTLADRLDGFAEPTRFHF